MHRFSAIGDGAAERVTNRRGDTGSVGGAGVPSGQAKAGLLRRPRRLLGNAHVGMRPPSFWLLAVLLGALSGLGAFGFRALIAFVHNLTFLGRLSFVYDANVHTTAAPWGLAVALVPAMGAIVVVFLVQHFAPEARGHGVPEVIDAIYYNKSVIRPIVAAIKALASALSIGTGGSVGREGPIIQIAAALGSLGGRVAPISRWQRATLVAAGGGAGIAATFNTPIGGVLFAAEILLPEISVRTMVPVALATTTATYVGRSLFGDHPTFPVPVLAVTTSLPMLPTYLVLGAVTALASVLFIRALYGADDGFERWIPGRPYLRHFIGMLGVGVLFTALHAWRGQYYVEGIGYATIVDVLSSPQSTWFLLILFFLKLAATSATLGSGASGGIFSPSLFMGATLGGAFGAVLSSLLPDAHIQPAVFALAGMAGMISGATGAVLTAIVMLFEMTLDYSVVLPMAFTASVSYGLRRLWLRESIYTMKLARRGHFIPEALHANAHLVHHVSDLALSLAAPLPADARVEDLNLGEHSDAPPFFVLLDTDRVVGSFSRDWARAHVEELRRAQPLREIVPSDYVVVPSNTTIFGTLARMQATQASTAVVVSPRPEGVEPPAEVPEVLGVISKAHLAEAFAEGMEMFEE